MPACGGYGQSQGSLRNPWVHVYTRNEEEPMLKEQTVSYTEHVVQRGPYHLSARQYPGEEPAIVLMHGCPDTMHLYDRLLPWLSPSHRVVTFDFGS